ncbi:MAG: AEC family transporter [Bacteroidaceae bacterium]|nr:AEC family transporter [Bacteroidaceae bacterium]
MTTFFILFRRMLALVFMMGCGYYAYKKEWVDENSYVSLSTIVANILNPILIINSVLGADHSAITGKSMATNLVFVLIYYGILIVVGLLMGPILGIKDASKHQYNLMTLFSNVGFMAIPVLSALYGSTATVYIVFYILLFNVLMYSYGIAVAVKTKGGKSSGIQWKKMINVGTVASLFAIVLYVFNVTADTVGDPLATICNYMGDATVPFSMFITGVSIAMFPVKEYLSGARVYIFSLIKLLILPVICAFVLKALAANGIDFDPMVKTVFIYELAMPVGALVLVINRIYGENEIISSKGIVISTLLSIITIPLVSFFI